MSFTDAQLQFFRAPEYAVIGASADPEKYGTKVLKWYQAHNKTVTPIHPKNSELEGLPTIKSVSELSSPQSTSLSIITPPKVTLGVLKEAKALHIPSIWIQPGADDEAVREYIKEEGLEDKVTLGGPCVLVSGEEIIAAIA